MNVSNFAGRWFRRLWTSLVAATLILSVAIASAQSLPYTEDFLDQTRSDLALTTADWGITSPGILQLGSEVSLENVAISGAVMGDGLDGPHSSRGVALGDFDGDGDLDAVVVNNSGEVNLVYTNTGGFFSTAPVDLGTSAANSLSVDVGDIDLDGDLDIVVGNMQNLNVYHLNDGTGTFGTAQSVHVNSGRTWPIKLVDVDGDGDLDVIEGQDQSRVNRIYRNSEADNGNLAFTAEDIGTDTFSTRSMVFGDVNNDGAVDMITGDHASNNHLYYGDGSGGFLASFEVQPAQAWNTFSLALADLNGDGALDLVEGRQRDAGGLNGETLVYLNNLSGGFLAPTVVAGSNTLHTTVALLTLDFDRDGDIDLIEGNNGSWDDDGDGGTTPEVAQPNRLFLNDGSGVFTLQDELAIAADNEQTYAMAAGDIDGDGILDFVTSNQTGENATYSLSGDDSLNPAVVQLHSVAQSTGVDDGSQSSRFARLVIDPADISVPSEAEIQFFLSNDGGAIFVPAPLDRPVEFESSGSGPFMWRAEMSTSSPLLSQRPTVSELTVALGEAFPIFQGPDSFSGIQGSVIQVQVDFSDADGDRLTYSLSGLPPQTGLSIDPDTGIISGTVSAEDEAALPITLTAGAFDGVRYRTGTITFESGAPNQPPVLDTALADQNVTEGVVVSIDVSGNFSDPDGDTLSFTQTGLPASMSISGAGVIGGTPIAADVGTHDVTVTATDPSGAFVSDTFTLTVDAANQGPVLDAPIGDQTVTEGEVANIDVSGSFSDPDGDTLTFTQTGLPGSMTISDAGLIGGTPIAADVGTHDVTVTATDPSGEFVTDTFTLTVEAANQGPVLDSPIGNRTVIEGNVVSISVSGNFSDPDGDALIFTATGLPASLSMSTAGVITGTTVTADVGAHVISVIATDPSGAFVSNSFTLTVDAAAPGNQSPVLDTAIGDRTATEGTAINIDVSGNFSDPDGDTLTFTATGLPASISFSAAGVFTGTPVAADVGTHNITVTATDPSGATAVDSFVVTVSAAPAPPPPPPTSSGGGGGGGSIGLLELAAIMLLVGFQLTARRRRRVR